MPLPITWPIRAPMWSSLVLGMPAMMSLSGLQPSFKAFEAVRASRDPISAPAASACFPVPDSASLIPASSLVVSATRDT